jgi:hypothetical protein
LDLSEDPTDNSDKEKKLGKGDSSHAIAFRAFDVDKQRVDLADGWTGEKPTGVSSRGRFEPDNWVLRMHSKKGQNNRDNVWAIRLQVDHKEKAAERKHRSTIWVDNCEQQNWAWSQDALWVIKRTTSVKHEEIMFDDAGFLPQIKKKDKKGNTNRDVLALNVSKQGGWTTDGSQLGQLWHVLSFCPSSGPGMTSTCAEARENTLALRGDVLFSLGKEKDSPDIVTPGGGGGSGPGSTVVSGNDDGKNEVCAHLAFKQVTGREYDDIVIGRHWVHDPSPRPGPDMATDSSSNHLPIERKDEKGIWIWVKIPENNVPPPWCPPRS